jgi:hypothetical protein
VSNANAATAPIQVDAAGNDWEGGPTDIAISGNVKFNRPPNLTSNAAR